MKKESEGIGVGGWMGSASSVGHGLRCLAVGCLSVCPSV